jgi:DNA-binding response OmpR family regulator
MPVEPRSQSTFSPRLRQTILLAEDDDTIRALVQVALQQAGFAVLVASDGRSAGDLFAAHPERFDLVLTDVIMPQALGTELAARVRKLRPDVPVLFMSAFPGGAGTAPDPLPSEEVLLEKPFTMATLLEVIHRTLSDGK